MLKTALDIDASKETMRTIKKSVYEMLRDKLRADDTLTKEQKAYILATVKHETAGRFTPLKEFGRGRGRRYGIRDRKTGHVYYGRGYVQLTWKRNYKVMGDKLGIDLVNNPDLACHPDVAYDIMILGMKEGLFTKKKLSDYINDKKVDYKNARRIINGMDRARLIAGYAKKFEAEV